MIDSVSGSRDSGTLAPLATDQVTDELLTRLVFKFARSLGAMRSTTQALLNGGDEDRAFRREMLSDMEAELRELQRLIDNVVQFRALAKGTFRLQPGTVLPSMMFWRLVDAWRSASASKRLDWRIDIPDSLDPLLADTEKVQQVLDNLLANVVRDSPPESAVIVSAGMLDDMVELRIESDASRMSSEEFGRVFEPFFTGRVHGRFPTGTGLGLHVARALAQAHGGSLELLPPEAEGQRMSWVLRLPGNPALAARSNGHEAAATH